MPKKKVQYDDTAFVTELKATFDKIECKHDLKVAKQLLKNRKQVLKRDGFKR